MLLFKTIWILTGVRLQTSEKRNTQRPQWPIPMVKVWKHYRSQASWWEDFRDVWKVNIGQCMLYRDYRKNVFPLDNQDVWLIWTSNVYSFSVNDNDGEIEGVVLGYQPPYFYMACGNCSKAIPEKQLTCGECGTSTKSATPQPEFHTTLVVETQQEEIKEVQIFTSIGQFSFAKRILIKSFYNRGKIFYIEFFLGLHIQVGHRNPQYGGKFRVSRGTWWPSWKNSEGDVEPLYFFHSSFSLQYICVFLEFVPLWLKNWMFQITYNKGRHEEYKAKEIVIIESAEKTEQT